MTIEIKAPTFPESVQDGTIATWHKKAGDSVSRDELIVDIETDKVVLEVVAPVSGVLVEILKEEGYENLYVNINSIGDKDSIVKFTKELTNYYRKNW